MGLRVLIRRSHWDTSRPGLREWPRLCVDRYPARILFTDLAGFPGQLTTAGWPQRLLFRAELFFGSFLLGMTRQNNIRANTALK